MKAIFRDVYVWTGRQRVGSVARMIKDGSDVLNYAPRDPAVPITDVLRITHRAS